MILSNDGRLTDFAHGLTNVNQCPMTHFEVPFFWPVQVGDECDEGRKRQYQHRNCQRASGLRQAFVISDTRHRQDRDQKQHPQNTDGIRFWSVTSTRMAWMSIVSFSACT